ncbi:winged helix-turn-helix domain-containing protein [Verrucosispora sp. NA02020]|uniref:winged helix-turn-helix domain-containing protein n=1 Tax=unclassified Micromonospora TaxID=2617518 RepID=UPI0015906D37|nr:winged helix-turn-helix domain-containing protein [Verrucosispora sp. NA02020]QKW13090.1 winged helix-turn-helix transcriptional regulator [Verrucosispora sp. NA02020]
MPQAPLYEQIINDVSTAVRAGTLKPGDKLPSIAELREQYESSAWPVRYALRILEERGWIVTRQGKGSFVASQPPI